MYETSNYQYDWTGTHHKSGQNLPDGVYYCHLKPNSKEYEYGNPKNGVLNITIVGSIQIIKN